MTNDLPMYTFTCSATGLANHSCGQAPLATPVVSGGAPGDCTGQLLTSHCSTVKCTDGGKGMISGKFNELCMFKGAHLRGLAPRPPYFHNGFANSTNVGGNTAQALLVAIQFYEDRFGFTFDPIGDVPGGTPRITGCGSALVPFSAPPQSAGTCPTPNAPSPTETDLVNFLQAL